MTQAQATDLRGFLNDELNKNGFSSVVDEIDRRLIESFDEPENRIRDDREALFFFLTEAIAILNEISNKNIESIISRINKNLDEGKIEGIQIQLPGKRQETFNLAELPDYQEISNLLREVLVDISNDNDKESTDDDSRN